MNNAVLRYSPTEINIIHSWELELYQMKFPLVNLYKATIAQGAYMNTFGAVFNPDVTSYPNPPVQINLDFDYDRRKYKIENGVRIKTDEVECILCIRQLSNLGITVAENDLLEIAGLKYIILRVEFTDLIPSTQEFLHRVAVIDLKNTFKA